MVTLSLRATTRTAPFKLSRRAGVKLSSSSWPCSRLVAALTLLVLAAIGWFVRSVVVVVVVNSNNWDAYSSSLLLLPIPQQQWNNDNDNNNYSPWLGCLTDDCIQQIATRIARAFPPHHNKSIWCHSAAAAAASRDNNNNNNKNQYSGLMLTKVPKGASSTCAGVVLRIAQRHDCSMVHWQHRWGRDYQDYNPHNPFLWTTVRDPAQRALSILFFHVVSRTPHRDVATSDAFLLQRHYLSTNTHAHYGTVAPEMAGFQLRYTTLWEDFNNTTTTTQQSQSQPAWNPDTPTHSSPQSRQDSDLDLVQRVLQTYSFILVPERMDESLVALALTLQIDVGDVLVASSKVSKAVQYHLLQYIRTFQQCVPVIPSFTSRAIQDYFASTPWRALNYGDYLFHAAAHISLNRTIQQYNDTLFDNALRRYRMLRALERQECATPDLPCSSEGIPQVARAARNCYLARYDFGCGYPCVDALLLSQDEDGEVAKQRNTNASTGD